MFRFLQRVPTRAAGIAPALARLSSDHLAGFALGPLAGLGARETSPEPVYFLSGMAVLSAGLVVLRAAQGAQRTVVRPVPVPVAAPMVGRRVYTAEEALAERDFRAGDREVLIDALAQAAETFYSIAGHLPPQASRRALGRADDLRELVWLNRAR